MSFIPYLHFRPAELKLSSDFCNEVINFYYFNGSLTSLLEGKNITEIEGYATGDFDMRPFKRMFASLRKQENVQRVASISDRDKFNMDKSGINWDPVPMIPSKLNSAIAISQKQPFEITAQCLDPLARKKKEKDLEFLRNKKKMEDVMQPMYDSMNLGKADLGATEHSSIPFKDLPLDLDIEDENEFRIFADIIYNLAPESAFETILEEYKDVKKLQQLKLMETTDQYKFGKSVHRSMESQTTDLPDVEYVYPGDVSTDRSKLPDYSDNTFRVIHMQVTPLELFKYFPNEIESEDKLYQIVNGKGGNDAINGYCNCNNALTQAPTNFSSYKMNLKYCEVKSVDYTTVVQKKNSRFKYLTEDENMGGQKIWAQNTYCFYWLANTKLFFGIDRLGFAHRAKGKEIYTGFSTDIYQSQTKSPVELCINENKKAQMADIKLQHEIVQALPDGYAVNIKYIRKAAQSMIDDNENTQYTLSEILEAGKERNIWIYETDDYEGKQNAPSPPVTRLTGGLTNTVNSYYSVLAHADQQISKYTGINDQLTGQSPNPDMLIGLQKLLINSSINALNHVSEALLAQFTSLFNSWAYYIQNIIKNGGAGKEALERQIGARKVDIIKGLNEIPLHQIGIKIKLGQREEEKANFKNNVLQLRERGVLNAMDEWMILNTPNPKDAMLLVATKEAKFAKKQDQKQKDQQEAQQKMVETQGQNMVQNTQTQTDGKIKQIQAAGAVDAELAKLASQLGMSQMQMDALIKLKLQKDRGDSQLDKSLRTLGAKNSLENQQPFQQ